MTATSKARTGGCQCGAVRFRVTRLGRPSIRHCRMCQKSFGGFFGPLATAHNAAWTRGEPKWFQSSNAARRAFCGDCGTPLVHETRFSLELAISAFDDPSAAAPQIQVNLADRLPFFDGLTSLPVRAEANDDWSEFLAGIHSN
ncbi:MAG: GFA family protein [Candidatus Devosia euplotis]|nr:GFA family protein [Candidatus Devosia euplotis]